MNMLPNPLFIAGIFVVIFFLSKWVNILNEYERAVTFWLGRLAPAPKGSAAAATPGSSRTTQSSVATAIDRIRRRSRRSCRNSASACTGSHESPS